MFKRLGLIFSFIGIVGCSVIGVSARAQLAKTELAGNQESGGQYPDEEAKFRPEWPRVRPGKVIDMLSFMVPRQKWGDERQFHLEGYMECLGVEGSDCAKNGESRHARGSFQKQHLMEPDSQGNTRFTTSKARTGSLGHPCEYYEIRESFDADGNPVQKLFVYAEMMDWVWNKQYRAYFDGMNEPLFEIARSNAIEGRYYLQNPGSGTDYFCNDQSVTYPLTDQVYVAYSYKLSRDTISEVNRRLGSMGSIEPKWIEMAEAMGEVEPELLVIQSYWGYVGVSPGKEGWRWYYRELYFYLKGVGWVSWRWQEHINHDLWNDFVTHKQLNMDTIVWEGPEEFVRNVALCEEIARGNPSTSVSTWKIRPSFASRAWQ